MGLLSPLLLSAKLFIQSLWQKKLDWDTAVNEKEMKEWEIIHTEIEDILNFQLPRLIEIGEENELICFTDASKAAYCAVLYLRARHGSKWTTSLVYSKTRVSPVRKITIPRLELIGVAIGVKCLNFVGKQLAIDFKCKRLFTDSQCVLHWLLDKKTLSLFVENRLREIRKENSIQFHYVDTSNNPADFGIGGSNLKDLKKSILFDGPAWLKDDFQKWSKWDYSNILPERLKDFGQETRGTKELYSVSSLGQAGSFGDMKLQTPFGLQINDFSTLGRLLRVKTWAIRFIKNLRKGKLSDPLNSKKITEARLIWEKHLQYESFNSTINNIKHSKMDQLQKMLGLKKDEEGILRCY